MYDMIWTMGSEHGLLSSNLWHGSSQSNCNPCLGMGATACTEHIYGMSRVFP